MRARWLAWVVAFVSLAAPALAQENSRDGREQTTMEMPAPGRTQELTLRDGSRLFGRVIAIESDRITFQTVAGAEVFVRRADIANLKLAEGTVVHEEFIPADPNATRLLFGPTARSLKRGEGYVGVYEFAIPFVQVGLTDRISIGAGTPLLFGGRGKRPFWFTPKVQVYGGRQAKVAVGLLHLTAGAGENVGIAYGVATLGTADSAVSIGMGYAYATGEGASPVAMIGAERRLHRRVKFVTENYVWRNAGLVTGGLRFIGDRLSADLGLVVPLGAGELLAFPVMNFVWAF